MKNIFSPFAKLIAVAACALTLGSCSRAEYAMLPKSASYHGVTRVATPVPPKAQRAATVEAPATSLPAATVAAAPKPAAAPTPAVTTTPERTSKESVAVATPATPAAAPAVEAAAVESAIATAPQAKQKPTRVQKFAATRLVRTVSAVAGISQFKQALSIAKTERVSGNLRTGVILLLIGLLISLFSGINRIFGLIGGVIAIIGLIFIILYLLDNL